MHKVKYPSFKSGQASLWFTLDEDTRYAYIQRSVDPIPTPIQRSMPAAIYLRIELAIMPLESTIQQTDQSLRPSSQTFLQLPGVSIGQEKSIHLTAPVDPPVDEPNSTDNPSTHTTPPDSSLVPSYN